MHRPCTLLVSQENITHNTREFLHIRRCCCLLLAAVVSCDTVFFPSRPISRRLFYSRTGGRLKEGKTKFKLPSPPSRLKLTKINLSFVEGGGKNERGRKKDNLGARQRERDEKFDLMRGSKLSRTSKCQELFENVVIEQQKFNFFSFFDDFVPVRCSLSFAAPPWVKETTKGDPKRSSQQSNPQKLL